MREIKLTVDGQKVELTDEQIEKLGLREKIEPFKRIEWQDYYYMDSFGRINKRVENFSSADDMFCLIGNRCNDKDLMTKFAKETVLTNLLRQFSIENGWTEEAWKDYKWSKFYICYSLDIKQYYIYNHNFIKIPGVVYFVSEEIARRALNEILLPFERGELEVCKIWEE